jgi:GntR family transcriptional regulator
MNIIRQKSIAEQAQTLLLARIQEHFYGPGNRLPSEDELANELGVSRATVRTALAALAAERIVIRKHGEGTFINEYFSGSTTRFEKIWEFSNLIEQSGRACTIQPLGLLNRLPSPAEVEALDISPNDLIVSIDRLFLADDDPAILSNNIIPVKTLTREITLDDVRQPIGDFLEKDCGQTLIYAFSDITAVISPPHVAELLHLSPGSPVLKFSEVFYNHSNEPLVVAQNYYDTHTLQLRIPRSFI